MASFNVKEKAGRNLRRARPVSYMNGRTEQIRTADLLQWGHGRRNPA